MKKFIGFTLLELLVTLAIIAILVAAVAPSIRQSLERHRVRAGVAELVSQIAWIKSDAVKRSNNAFVSIVPGANWCYGLSDVGYCNCQVNACTVGGVSKRVQSSDLPSVTMATTFPNQGGGIFGFQFDRDGMPSSTNAVTFNSVNGGNGSISVNIVGNVTAVYP